MLSRFKTCNDMLQVSISFCLGQGSTEPLKSHKMIVILFLIVRILTLKKLMKSLLLRALGIHGLIEL